MINKFVKGVVGVGFLMTVAGAGYAGECSTSDSSCTVSILNHTKQNWTVVYRASGDRGHDGFHAHTKVFGDGIYKPNLTGSAIRSVHGWTKGMYGDVGFQAYYVNQSRSAVMVVNYLYQGSVGTEYNAKIYKLSSYDQWDKSTRYTAHVETGTSSPTITITEANAETPITATAPALTDHPFYTTEKDSDGKHIIAHKIQITSGTLDAYAYESDGKPAYIAPKNHYISMASYSVGAMNSKDPSAPIWNKLVPPSPSRLRLSNNAATLVGFDSKPSMTSFIFDPKDTATTADTIMVQQSILNPQKGDDSVAADSLGQTVFNSQPLDTKTKPKTVDEFANYTVSLWFDTAQPSVYGNGEAQIPFHVQIKDGSKAIDPNTTLGQQLYNDVYFTANTIQSDLPGDAHPGDIVTNAYHAPAEEKNSDNIFIAKHQGPYQSSANAAQVPLASQPVTSSSDKTFYLSSMVKRGQEFLQANLCEMDDDTDAVICKPSDATTGVIMQDPDESNNKFELNTISPTELTFSHDPLANSVNENEFPVVMGRMLNTDSEDPFIRALPAYFMDKSFRNLEASSEDKSALKKDSKQDAPGIANFPGTVRAIDIYGNLFAGEAKLPNN